MNDNAEFLDKFTSHLKNVIRDAADLASELQHTSLEPEHLLYGLVQQKGSIGTELLTKAGFTSESLKEAVIRKNSLPAPSHVPEQPTQPMLSEESKQAIEKAVLIANQFEHKYVGTEHLLAGLLKLDSPALQEVFRAHRASSSELQQQLMLVLKNTSKFPDLTNLFEQTGGIALDEEAATSPDAIGPKMKERPSGLEFFCTNLTDEHLQQTIDPVIGREKEIERLIHILSRRTKNNPVLVGDPGVGKTAIVEGLAKRILQGNVPSVLANKRIMSLDLSLVVAGTVYRGEFEGRIKQIIDEVKQDPNIVLFIDELHTIIGAGGASGALDAANILKPALAKGQLRCIGATTHDEYRKHIESDPALERRFQPILVDEPTEAEAVDVLRGIKENYEQYHRVGISEDAVQAAVALSVRYVQDKFLPDKAIDLIDEAASKVKITKRDDETYEQLRALEERLTVVREKKQQAVQTERFDEALTLKRQEEALVTEAATMREGLKKKERKLVGHITEKDIAMIVSRATGVPVGNIMQQEQKKLQHLERHLQKRIIGQSNVLQTLAGFIRRSRTGLSAPNRPLGSFIFLGPSGVGKTETAKALAETVFGSEQALVRLDMSEFSESFQASKLIGAPAGYVGYKEGGKLTESVKRKPYSVVLFDEIEKAHPDIFNLLLQILDEGHITDATGRHINFRNTIIILTSNIGLQEFNRQAAIGFSDTERTARQESAFQRLEEKMHEDLKRHFRPEFLNRFDKILMFQPLTRKHCEAIAHLQLQEVQERLADRDIVLTVAPAVRRYLAKKGANPDHGARGLRRLIQEQVENQVADAILAAGKIPPSRFYLDVRGEELRLSQR